MADHAHADDNVDIAEMFAAIRPSVPASLICGLLIGALAFFYAESLDKQYTATAQFIFDKGSNPQSSFEALVPGFSAGSSGTSETDLTSAKIMSRNFIRGLLTDNVIDIQNDPFFSSPPADSEGVGGILDSFFTREPLSPEKEFEQFVNRYRRSIGVSIANDSGVIDLNVSHSNPDRAALLANAVMERHIENIENKRVQSDQREIELTKNRLLRVQEGLDNALEAARVFAVENGVQPMQDLGLSSMGLTRFRRELERLDVKLEGIERIEALREASSSRTIDIDDFSRRHPIAYSSLQSDLGWSAEEEDPPFPTGSRLRNLKQSISAERDQLQRTVSIMETEAAEKAQAAGRLAELEREIEVQKTIYASLTTQFEARELSAELQGENAEVIQWATAPLFPSAPRVNLISLTAFLVGTLAMLALAFLRTRLAGTLYTNAKLEQVFSRPVDADNIGSSVGTRLKPPNSLIGRSSPSSNIGLTDLILNIRDSAARKIAVLSVPSSPVAHNLAIVLGEGLISEEGKKVAIVNLAKHKNMSGKAFMDDRGSLESTAGNVDIAVFDWTGGPGSGEDMTRLEDALSFLDDTYDHTVIVCAALRVGGVLNKIVLGHADHVIVVAKKGTTTQDHVKWVDRLLPAERVMGRNLVTC